MDGRQKIGGIATCVTTLGGIGLSALGKYTEWPPWVVWVLALVGIAWVASVIVLVWPAKKPATEPEGKRGTGSTSFNVPGSNLDIEDVESTADNLVIAPKSTIKGRRIRHAPRGD